MTPEQIALMAEFKRLVNMTVAEMQAHFATPESDTVSLDPRVAKKLKLMSGKTAGKAALALKAKQEAGEEFSEDDWKSVAGIVNKLKFQLGRKAVFSTSEGTPTPITLALRNRGHDPLKVQLSEAETTLWDFEKLVRAAVDEFFEAMVGGQWIHELFGERPWIRDVFPISRYVVLEWDSDLYRLDYVVDPETGDVTVVPGTLTQVERLYVPVTVQADVVAPVDPASEIALVDTVSEAEGEAGPKWTGIMIRAGAAKNRAANGLPRIYTEEALKAAVEEKLFDGVYGYQVTDAEHVAKADAEPAGIWGKAWWDPIVKAVRNTFTWFKDKYPALIHAKVKAAIAEGKTSDLPGFSITGTVDLLAPNSNVITKILSIRSCDPISFPSAGGTLTAVTESTTNTRTTMNALKALKGLGLVVPPKLAKQYESVSVAEGAAAEFMISELKAKSPKMFERDPDLETKLMKDEKMVVNMFMTFMEAQGVEPASDPAKGAEPGTEPNAVNEALDELAELRISQALSTSGLPEAHQALIRKSFKGRRPHASEITEAVNEHRALVADASKKSGAVVSVIESGEDKAAQLVNDFFFQDVANVTTRKEIAESMDITLSPHSKGTVRSFRELLRHLAPGINWSQSLTGVNVAEAMDTTIATALLTNGINARIVHTYRNNAKYDGWRQFATVVNQGDYQTKKAMAFGGFTGFAEIGKTDEFPALTESGSSVEDYTLTRRGGIITISEIDIRNDNVGAILQLPTRLAVHAKRKKSAFVWGLITSNPTLDVDSKALFHADHANLLNIALDPSALKDAIGKLQAQVHPNDTDLLATTPRFLCVGINPDMQELAYKLTTIAAGEGNAVATWSQSFGMQVLVNPHMAATNGNWYLIGDPTEVPVVEIGELDGRDEPEVSVSMQEGVGAWFTNGDAKWRVKHVYNGTVVSYKGLVGAIQA